MGPRCRMHTVGDADASEQPSHTNFWRLLFSAPSTHTHGQSIVVFIEASTIDIWEPICP